MRTILTAVATFGTCDAVKRYLNRPARKDAEYANGQVRLTMLWNHGAAFGLKIPAEVLYALSGAALGTVWMERRRSPVAAGLVLGGGLSNLKERLFCGKVYDYIQFPRFPGKLKNYIFNLADFAVFAGSIAILFGRKK